MTDCRPRTSLATAVAELQPVGLSTVLEQADLQTRTERKYLVPPWALEALVDGLRDDFQALETAGLRVFRYESVYFDTPGLTSYRAAAHGRRRRFKVRTRTYLDSGLCVLEVKTRGGRDETVKDRMPYRPDRRDRLDRAATDFVLSRVPLVDGADALEQTLVTTYSRVTLVDLAAGARVTCDVDLVLSDPTGESARLDDRVLVETKSPGSAGPADRILWRLGLRPVAISKYCVGLAALHPGLPANRWHRTLKHHFADRL